MQREDFQSQQTLICPQEGKEEVILKSTGTYSNFNIQIHTMPSSLEGVIALKKITSVV